MEEETSTNSTTEYNFKKPEDKSKTIYTRNYIQLSRTFCEVQNSTDIPTTRN